MDAVDRAIKNNRHLSDKEKWNEQRWEAFYREISGKQLFVFGVGTVLPEFFMDNSGRIEIEAIIDNNSEFQSFCATELISGAESITIQIPKIQNAEILLQYPKDTVAVLITSLNHYQEMADQLEQLGITNIYIFLCMEANKRIADGSVFCHKDVSDQYQDYVQKYLEQPIEPRKIVFEISIHGETARRVTKCLQVLCPDLDIVWVIQRPEDLLGYHVRCIHKNNWLQYIREMETAAIWAWETIVPSYIKKREEQIYIYLKHWTITLKNVGPNIAMAHSDWYDKSNQVRNAQEMDFVFGCSRFDKDSFLTSYGIGNVVDVGSPKADVLFAVEQNRERVHEFYGLDEQVKIAIYAPTFRWSLDGKDSFAVTAERIRIDYDGLRKSVEERFGDEWAFFVRLHPTVAAKSDRLSLPEYVVDSSSYRHAEELISAADLVITDYSSVMFEAAFIAKPVFLYATDRCEYVERERDLLLDYDKLPFPMAESDEQLQENILSFDEERYKQEVRVFLDELGSHEDGHSGERAAEFIKGLMRNKP